MLNKALEIKRKDLIERLGVYFEKEKNMPPLAARIMGTLILNGQKGMTFEDLVNDLQASKSTIFNHLNSLEAQNKIHYFTKCGDRKKYFSMAPGYILRKIDFLKSHWFDEIDIQKDLLSYKKDFNKQYPNQPLSLKFQENAIRFLEETVDFLNQQAENFKPVENN